MKLQTKLTLLFTALFCSATLIIFSLIYRSFSISYEERFVKETLNQAEYLGEIISESMDFNNMHEFMGRGCKRRKRNFNNADNEFFLVSGNNLLCPNKTVALENLDENTKALAETALKGESAYKTYDNPLLSYKTASVAVPIEGSAYGLIFNRNRNQFEGEVAKEKSKMIIILIIGNIIGITAIHFISRRISDTIRDISWVADEISKGNYGKTITKRSNDELGDLSLHINEMSEILKSNEEEREKIERQKENFISDIAHELKTPVAVIKALSEGASDGIYELNCELIQSFKNQSENLDDLIQNLLQYSKLKNMNFKPEKKEIPINEVLSDALHSLKPLINENDMKITKHISSNPVILADYGLVKRLFYILLDNAIKHGTGKEIIINVNENSISVINESEYISKEAISSIFERFYKIDPKGNGLGLAIAEEIVKMHNWSISAEYSEGYVTFKINF